MKPKQYTHNGKTITKDEYFKCRRKIGYPKPKHAENQIRRLKKSGQMCFKLQVYPCKYCAKYHIGHETTIKKILGIK